MWSRGEKSRYDIRNDIFHVFPMFDRPGLIAYVCHNVRYDAQPVLMNHFYIVVVFFVFIRLSTSFHMWVCHGNFQTCKLWITRHASNFTCLYRNTLPFGMKNFNFIQWIYILLFNVAKESSLVEKRTITKSALNILHDDNSMFEYDMNTIIHMQL